MALVVTDTGIGIDAAALESLGQPFRQADASIGRKFGGSGLGLAISRKLLTLHGGALTIESVPGQGTTVRAMLPRERIVEATPSVEGYTRARTICLTRATSERLAATASAASASSAGSCPGRATSEATTRQTPIAPRASSAASAAGGKARSAGSQIARSTANGSRERRRRAPPRRFPDRAAAADVCDREGGVFPRRSPQPHRRPAPTCAVAPPSSRDSSGSVGMTRVAGDHRGRDDQCPGTQRRIQPASQTEADQRIAALLRSAVAPPLRAPAAVPPPIATRHPRRRAMRASAASPTTIADSSPAGGGQGESRERLGPLPHPLPQGRGRAQLPSPAFRPNATRGVLPRRRLR